MVGTSGELALRRVPAVWCLGLAHARPSTMVRFARPLASAGLRRPPPAPLRASAPRLRSAPPLRGSAPRLRSAPPLRASAPRLRSASRVRFRSWRDARGAWCRVPRANTPLTRVVRRAWCDGGNGARRASRVVRRARRACGVPRGGCPDPRYVHRCNGPPPPTAKRQPHDPT